MKAQQAEIERGLAFPRSGGTDCRRSRSGRIASRRRLAHTGMVQPGFWLDGASDKCANVLTRSSRRSV
jgi:hypothetical protein